MENQASMTIDTIEIGKISLLDYYPITLLSNKGKVYTRFTPASGETNAVILIGDATEGFKSPAGDLYMKLSRDLPLFRYSVLHISYRHPTSMIESVLDVVAGVKFLHSFGIESISIVGHSFGAAVAIQAAANTPFVYTVVALSAQSYGAEVVRYLPDTAMLFIHGTEDTILAPSNSEYLHDLAVGTKKIILHPKTGHELHEVADRVYTDTYRWIRKTNPV